VAYTKPEDRGPIAQAKKEARMVAEKYRGQLEELRKRFGTRPWDDPKNTQSQALAAYAAVKDDPEFWHQAVLLEGRKLGLSDGFVPRALFEDAQKMHAKYMAAAANGTLPPAADVPLPQDTQGGGQ
jgi:hypothetical protein